MSVWQNPATYLLRRRTTMPRQSFFFEEPLTIEDLQILQRLLGRTTSEASRQAVCDALKRIACPHNCFEIEGQTFCLITVTAKPFVQKMGTPHSCEQEEANRAGYHRLNALAQVWQDAVQMLSQPPNEES
jgi:hypothetical protein